MLIVSIYIVGSFLTPTFSIEPTKYMKSKKDVFANFYGSFEPTKGS